MSGFGTSNDAARQAAAAAASEASAAKRDTRDLERELAKMRLACAAVWELVKEKANLKEDDLVAKMAELDARDGVADGMLTRRIRNCVSCQRVVAPKQNKCMYCGTVQPIDSVFEAL